MAAQEHQFAYVIGVVVRAGSRAWRSIVGPSPWGTFANRSVDRSLMRSQRQLRFGSKCGALFRQALASGGSGDLGTIALPGIPGHSCRLALLANSRMSHCARRRCSSISHGEWAAPFGRLPCRSAGTSFTAVSKFAWASLSVRSFTSCSRSVLFWVGARCCCGGHGLFLLFSIG